MGPRRALGWTGTRGSEPVCSREARPPARALWAEGAPGCPVVPGISAWSGAAPRRTAPLSRGGLSASQAPGADFPLLRPSQPCVGLNVHPTWLRVCVPTWGGGPPRPCWREAPSRRGAVQRNGDCPLGPCDRAGHGCGGFRPASAGRGTWVSRRLGKGAGRAFPPGGASRPLPTAAPLAADAELKLTLP